MAASELYSTKFINDANLKAYYRFNSGALTTDSSGNSVTLTNNNTVGETSNGKFGYAADFGSSNTNKYFSSSNNLGIEGGNITISLWVKLSAEVSGTNTIFDFVNQANNNNSNYVYYSIRYVYNSGTPRIEFLRVKPGVAADRASYNITLGTTNWNLLTLTYDGTNVIGYLNGVQVATVASSGVGNSLIPNPGISIGALTNPLYFVSGVIDDVSFFNRTLDSTEVGLLYNYPASSNFFAFF